MVTDTNTPPDIIARYPDGKIRYEQWCNKNGEMHRADGPAYVGYDPDGAVTVEEWRKNGKLHRINAPASIDYFEDGTIEEEHWWQNGVLHRDGAPASITHNLDGSIQEEEWWQNGHPVSYTHLTLPTICSV